MSRELNEIKLALAQLSKQVAALENKKVYYSLEEATSRATPMGRMKRKFWDDQYAITGADLEADDWEIF